MTMTGQMSNRASVHSPYITIPGSRDWFLIRHTRSFVIFKVVHLKRKLTKVRRGSRCKQSSIYSSLWDSPWEKREKLRQLFLARHGAREEDPS